MTSKLNKTEKYKCQVDLKEYYAKLESLREENLSEADRFYLKNFGIYNSILKPEHFMVRIRVPAGRLELDKLKSILDIAKDLNAKITITARAQLELQQLNLKRAILAHKQLNKLGITTFATLTDNIRNIVTDVLDGIAKDSKFSCYDTILKMQDEFIKIENLSKVPRKFNTAISSNISNIEPFFTNDCYFGAARKDDILGFKLYLGGKNTNFAQDMDIFVTKDSVVDLYKAVVKTYIKYGNRASRTKARLHFLIEELGVDGFKEKLKEFFKEKFISGATLLENRCEIKDFYELKNGDFAYCYRSNFAEISLDEFYKIFNYAKKHSLEIRLGVDQNIYLIGLKSKSIELKSLAKAKNAKVCVGLKYCGFSIYDTKRASYKIDFNRLNNLDVKISFSGCLKGCARHIASDIGFVGIRTNLYGTKEFAVRLYLGAFYTSLKYPARLIYWAVPLRFLNKMINIILDEFEGSRYESFEEFSKEILSKFSVEFLALYFLKKLDKQNIKLLASQKESREASELYNDIKSLEKKLYSIKSQTV